MKSFDAHLRAREEAMTAKAIAEELAVMRAIMEAHEKEQAREAARAKEEGRRAYWRARHYGGGGLDAKIAGAVARDKT